MTLRRTLLAAIAALGVAATVPAAAQDLNFADEIPTLRIGLLGGENQQDTLARFDAFKTLVSETFGVAVEVFPSADYAGVMQGLSAGQLDVAALGASGYAGTWLDCQCVEPVVVAKEADGSTGYYSVLYVRSDSPFMSMDDLKGKTLAFADENSTSGYLYPNFELREGGYDPATFFASTAFAGGHEQGVVAVLNRQFDAGVTWVSGVGEESEGYSRGNLHAMVEKGMLDMADLRILWKSSLIPNGPWTIRSALPADFKAAFLDFMLKLPTEHPEIYADVERGVGSGYEQVGHDFFSGVIKLREDEISGRRS